MSYALVLGSGGVAGVSWTLGVLTGLVRNGALDPASAALVVGTSAGSLIASVIAAGHDLESYVARETVVEPNDGLRDYFESVDAAVAGEIFQLWSTAEDMTTPIARAIGERALRATSADPEEWIARTAGRIPGVEWGDGRLRIVAVDADSGERVVWDGTGGEDVSRAIAASSAVPGLVPPIPIGSRRYVDGGVWSSTNADLALDVPCERVLVTCPQARLGLLRNPSMRALEREQNLLEQAGRTVVVLTPGPAYDQLGPNHMSARLRGPALEIGLQDGAAAAERVRAAGFAPSPPDRSPAERSL